MHYFFDGYSLSAVSSVMLFWRLSFLFHRKFTPGRYRYFDILFSKFRERYHVVILVFIILYNSDRSNLDSVSLIEIARSPNFVDKTLFIQRVLECGPKNLLITAPRRFGKSINLDMLQCFLANRNYYDVFSQLKIGRTSIMNYCGRFPVLWVNFRKSSAINSYEDAVVSCRTGYVID